VVHPLLVILLQALKGSGLKSLKDLCIRPLHLPIALGVVGGGVVDLDAHIITICLEHNAGEVCAIIGDDAVWHPEPGYNSFEEIGGRMPVDCSDRHSFRSLGELVNGNIEVLVATNSFGKRTEGIHPPDHKRPRQGDELYELRRCVDLLCMVLACFASPDHFCRILEVCRPVEAMPEGFPDHHAGCRMTPALAFMHILKDLEAFLLGDTLEQNAVGCAVIEVPFYHHISFCLTDDAFHRSLISRKDVVFQELPNLLDPVPGVHSRGSLGFLPLGRVITLRGFELLGVKLVGPRGLWLPGVRVLGPPIPGLRDDAVPWPRDHRHFHEFFL